MSRRSPRRLSVALDGLTNALEPASVLARVQRVWEQAAGPAIAAAGRPASERDGVLTVVCADSMWAQEIELMGDEVVSRLNEELKEDLVARLRCRTG